MRKNKGINVVLLGDSIFDNQPYVLADQAVIDKLNQIKNSDVNVELLAVDGATTYDVSSQCEVVGESTTHLILSCGGNNALGYLPVFDQEVSSVFEGMQYLTEIKKEFEVQYKEILMYLAAFNKNIVLCSIYNQCPGTAESLLTALSVFNDVIFQEAFRFGYPVLDLRLIFNSPSDYSSTSPIEPSETGGLKLAEAILNTLETHDFSTKHSVVYC